MKKFSLVTLLTVLASLLVTPRAHAAVDEFFQLPDTPGESQDARHKNWIDVLAYGESVSGSTRSFSITVHTDRSYPKLVAAAGSGQIFRNATLELRRAGGNPIVFLTVAYENVRIISVSTDASSGADRPNAQVIFTCDRATWKYTPQKADGSADTANVVTNTIDFRNLAPPPAVAPPQTPRLVR